MNFVTKEIGISVQDIFQILWDKGTYELGVKKV